MPETDCPSPLPSIGKSNKSSKRDQSHSMDSSQDPTSFELELEMFQKQVAEQFVALSSSGSDELLSLSWVCKLLDTFICCKQQFRIILFNNKSCLGRMPMDRIIGEFHERSVKGLDVCNAIRDGVELVRQWEKLLEMVLCALDNQKSIGEGHARRAKKALIDLLIGMLDEKESNAALSQRNRSFGRQNGSSKDQKNSGHYRSLSWSVSRSWSASKQLQAMAHNLNAPKGNDVMATNGLAVAVYTMSCVLFLVMWVLVAAIPCQDRGLHTHFSVPKQFIWAAPVSSIYDRILEESKKRERKNACGLLKEVYQTEKWMRQMNELLDTLQFPLSEEKEGEVRQKVDEIKQVFGNMKDGLMPLERQVREVFHLIVRIRTEGLDSFGRNGNAE